MFVIRREDGAYVNKPGSKSNYTPRLQQAQMFSTREAAATNKCGNETVVEVSPRYDSGNSGGWSFKPV